jgi:hypothetical protein
MWLIEATKLSVSPLNIRQDILGIGLPSQLTHSATIYGTAVLMWDELGNCGRKIGGVSKTVAAPTFVDAANIAIIE